MHLRCVFWLSLLALLHLCMGQGDAESCEADDPTMCGRPNHDMLLDMSLKEAREVLQLGPSALGTSCNG